MGFQNGDKPTNVRQTFDPMKKDTYYYARYPGTKSKSLIFQSNAFDDYYKFAKDDLFAIKKGISFQPNFTYYKLFGDEIQKLIESGIAKSHEIKYLNRKQFRGRYKIVPKEIELKVLSMEDLKAGFIIWLVAVLISIIVFIFEKIFFQITYKKDYFDTFPEIQKNRRAKEKQKSKKIKNLQPKNKKRRRVGVSTPINLNITRILGGSCNVSTIDS